MKRFSIHIVLMLAIAAVPPFIQASQAEAALGDFLFKWEAEYDFARVWGIETDASGYVYLLDEYKGKVCVLDSGGNLIREWGNYGGGDGQFRNPRSITTDAAGNVYVADTKNDRIQVFDSAGNFITKWGSYGTGDGQFDEPHGIEVDADGNVYVADTYNSRIQVFDSAGNFIRKWGSWGYGDGYLYYPLGLAVDAAGNVYIADTHPHGVQVFDSNGTFLRKLVSGSPSDIAINEAGNVYVVTGNSVKVFDNSGNFITQWGSYGYGDGQFIYPWGIAVGPDGNVYVSETFTNNRIQVFDSMGTFITRWNSYGHGEGQFVGPTGISTGPDGNIYVLDWLVKVLDRIGNFMSQWNVDGSNCCTDLEVGPSGNVYVVERYGVQVLDSTGNLITKWGNYGSGDGQFNNARGIAVDKNSNVYVADSENNRIQVFDSSGTFLRKWGSFGSGYGQFSSPENIAVDAVGNVYVADTANYRIQVFNNQGTFLRTWGDEGYGDGQFNYPYDVAVDAVGNVYVADTYSHRIQVFNSVGSFIAKWGGYGNGEGQFYQPLALMVGPEGNVYVADTYNHRIQVFDGLTQGWPPVAKAGPDQHMECPATQAVDVTLDGTGSYDLDGDDLTYTWIGPFGTATGVSPTVTLPYWGAWYLPLTVEAIDGTDTDEVEITVGDTIPPMTTASVVGVKDETGVYTSDVTVTLTSTDDCTGVKEIHYTINGAPYVENFDPAVAIGSVDFTLTEDGTYVITYWAVDDAGPGPVSSTTINATPSAGGGGGGGGYYPSCVKVELKYDETGELYYSLDGGATWHPYTGEFEICQEQTTTLTYGYMAPSGNVENPKTIVINIHQYPPVLQLPGDITAEATGASGAVVTYTVTATDEVDPNPVVVCNPSSGNVFPLGTTPVSCTATDFGGHTASGGFNVTVVDSTPPVLSLPSDMTVEATAPNGAAVTFEATADDVVDGVFPATCAPPSGTTFALGTTAVACSATDTAGNTASGGFNVTVEDTTPPVITILNVADGQQYELGLFNSPGYTVTDSATGVASSTDSLTGGDGFGLGAFTYSVTAYDSAGNSTTVTVNYTVIASIDGLQALVGQYGASGDIIPALQTDLLDDLDSAEQATNAGDPEEADRQLDKFKAHIDQGKDRGDITVEAAGVLTNAANYVMANN